MSLGRAHLRVPLWCPTVHDLISRISPASFLSAAQTFVWWKRRKTRNQNAICFCCTWANSHFIFIRAQRRGPLTDLRTPSVASAARVAPSLHTTGGRAGQRSGPTRLTHRASACRREVVGTLAFVHNAASGISNITINSDRKSHFNTFKS